MRRTIRHRRSRRPGHPIRLRSLSGGVLLCIILTGTVAVPVLHDSILTRLLPHEHSHDRPGAPSPAQPIPQLVSPCPVCSGHPAPAAAVPNVIDQPHGPLAVADAPSPPAETIPFPPLLGSQARAPPARS